MLTFVTRRILLAILVIAGVIVVTFVVAHIAPGDPAATWAGPARHGGPGHAGPDVSRPGAAPRSACVLPQRDRGRELGTSIHTHRPVLSDIATAAPATLELVITALLLAIAVGVLLGLVSARRPGRPADQVIRAGSILGADAGLLDGPQHAGPGLQNPAQPLDR